MQIERILGTLGNFGIVHVTTFLAVSGLVAFGQGRPQKRSFAALERLLYRERREIKAETIREDSKVLTKYDRMDIVDRTSKESKE